MNAKRYKLETVEDLAAWLVDHPIADEVRYQLRDFTHYTWDDPVAGEAWMNEKYGSGSKFKYQSRSEFTTWTDDGKQVFDEEGYEKANAAYEVKEREWGSRKPSEHQVTDWTLETNHGSSFSLSDDLGRKIDSVWTKKPTYHNSPYLDRKGTMTIKGILKRLGADAGLSQQIADAKSAAEHKQEVRNVNYARSSIRQHAAEIIKLVEKAQLGDESEQIIILLENLAACQEMKE